MPKIFSTPSHRPLPGEARSPSPDSRTSSADAKSPVRPVFTRSSSSARKADALADRQASLDQASAALGHAMGEALLHVRSEAAASAAGTASGKGIDALLARYLRPAEAAADSEIATAQAVMDALKGVFAQLTPWESVSRLKAQAMEAELLKWAESTEIVPEDRMVLDMSPEEFEQFKNVLKREFESDFDKMGFPALLSNESVS